ncbi:MAG: endonuclease/exonuclease/phosphatase family protein [Candidatus Aminicenantes bacterium]|nr:endonuclease/exonuclease/phosphatase family protein [Candidatus Aminicenantes bacterium]
MRFRSILKVFILSLACSLFGFNLESTVSFPETSIRILSFNIRYDNAGDGDNAWPNRKQMVAQTIRFHKVDIIGIQEALYTQLLDLQALLTEYDWRGVGRDDGQTKGEFAPVFFKKDYFHVIKSGNFWLSEHPDKPGKGWDAACPRVVTWVEFKHKRSGTIFYFFNTHFDHMGSEARKNSAVLLLKRIDQIDEKIPLILSGDFNCTSQEDPYKILTTGLNKKSGLQNSMDISLYGHYGGTQTFNGFDEVKRPGMIIDFIFVKSVEKVLHHGIVAEKWDNRYVSDHYPVYAEIQLRLKNNQQ